MGTESTIVDYLESSIGKPWPVNLEHNGSTKDDPTGAKSEHEQTIASQIDGLYPEWDEFYLLVCDICGIIIRPQALEKHLATKHQVSVQNNTSTANTTPISTDANKTPSSTNNNNTNNNGSNSSGKLQKLQKPQPQQAKPPQKNTFKNCTNGFGGNSKSCSISNKQPKLGQNSLHNNHNHKQTNNHNHNHNHHHDNNNIHHPADLNLNSGTINNSISLNSINQNHHNHNHNHNHEQQQHHNSLPQINLNGKLDQNGFFDPTYYGLEPLSSPASPTTSSSSSSHSMSIPLNRTTPPLPASLLRYQDRKWRNTFNILRDAFL